MKITTNYDNVISHKADKIMASFDIIPKINSIETMSLWLCINSPLSIRIDYRSLIIANWVQYHIGHIKNWFRHVSPIKP